MIVRTEHSRGLAGVLILLLLAGCADRFRTQQQEKPPTNTVQPAVPTQEDHATQSIEGISGFVTDENGPVSGAIVRVQATKHFTVSGTDGMFSLSFHDIGSGTFKLTGWARGYFCSEPVEAIPGDEDIEILLHAHSPEDNPDYHWLPSRFHPGQGEDQGCAECHSRVKTDLPFSLPVDEWMLDAHAQSASNPRFLTMYNGTHVNGDQSPLTRRAFSRDYGTFPLGPDLSQPYYGPGYKLDFPKTAGNCAACHIPAAAVDDPYGIDPNSVIGVEAEGLPCDFCHKVWDVQLDHATELPYPNMPGVLSMEFRRPAEGHQFFAGPFDDVAPGEDTYSALQTESAYCASCHFGVFWDTLIYNSYGEWLESPYSDPDTGRNCQDCHMPPTGATQFATSTAGGLTRDPDTIFSHRMPGASDEALLQDALTMKVEAQREGGEIVVTVTLTNDRTGHHVPTDSPLRNMILLVQAEDVNGEPLTHASGPTVPSWGGVGDPAGGYYAGLPGMGYAKILMELWTGISPSGAYWNPTRVVSDNRLAAFTSDASVYIFDAPEGPAEVRVVLLFRRAFKDLMDQKGWDVPDIVMEQAHLTIP